MTTDDVAEELREFCARMRRRTYRQLELAGSIPTGWHVLLADGEFGFIDVELPANPGELDELIGKMRGYLREMGARACLFVTPRRLADGREVLFFQFEARDDQRGQRLRGCYFDAARPDGGAPVDADELRELWPTDPKDRELAQAGLFPDLLPQPLPLPA